MRPQDNEIKKFINKNGDKVFSDLSVENYDEIQTLKATKADKTEIPDTSNFATKGELEDVNLRIDVQESTLSTVVTDVDTMSIQVGQLQSNVDDLDLDKADKNSVYTKSETNDLLDNKQDAGDYATNTTVTDYYNELTQDIDDLSTIVDSKANQSDTYTKDEVDEKFTHVTVDAYTKEETNTLLSAKANQTSLNQTNNNVDALTGEVENIAGELDSKADKSEIPTIPTNISYFNNDSGYVDNTYHDVTKQDVISDLSTIRVNAQIGAGLSTQVEANTTNISYLDGKVRDIELFKSPNVLIQGEPTINNGQVTGLSKTNYLILPFEFDVKDRAFELTYAFRTGNDVTTPQNLFGSKFSIASYVSGGKLTVRISSNGTSWDLLDLITNLDIQANTTYYIKLIFNKLSYEIKSSADGVEYSQIGYKVDTRSPFAEDVFIGIGNNQNNPFLGMINLHKWELKYNNVVFWEGMDDAGLATRADISLSNLDEIGQAKFDAKQNKLNAGANIIIDENTNTISSIGGGDTSDCVHISGEETITGKKIFTGGSGGSTSDVSLQTKNALAVGDETQTQYTGIYNHRKCSGDSNVVNTAGFLVNSDGSAKFTHKRGSTTAVGTADDSYIRFNKTTLVYSDSSSATSEKNILHTGNAYDKTSVDSLLSNKQDVISDIETIRTNASNGSIAKTTVDAHVANSTIHVTANDKVTWSQKQNAITDLDTIRAGAELGATALQSYTETDPIYTADKPNIALKSEIPDISGLASESYVQNYHDNTKQDTLVSGTSIKTINNQSILGEGNITVTGDAPTYIANTKTLRFGG